MQRDKIVLFDIDETLIDSGRAGTRALNRAFFHIFNVKDAFKGIKMAGMTDTQIIKEGLRTNSLPCMNGEIEMVKKKYLEFLAIEINNPWRHIKPGVMEFLETLKRDGIAIGLLTGNLQEGAMIKLKPFGLDGYFLTGAFGSDHEERDRLLPIALKRFSALGINVLPERCIIIGDTPRDVRCAKIHGARSIGVATGPYNPDVLLNTGADLVVNSLLELERCTDFIRSV